VVGGGHAPGGGDSVRTGRRPRRPRRSQRDPHGTGVGDRRPDNGAADGGGDAHADAPPLPVVSGDIFYRERIVLPPDATVQVRVVRLGSRGGSRPVVAELAFAAPRRLPIPFKLECDLQALEPGASYGLEASISRRGMVEFATVEPVPVLAGGLPTSGLKILVRRTR